VVGVAQLLKDMKKKNTNGLAGGEKGWQACETRTAIGVILGYDHSTYEGILSGLDPNHGEAIGRALRGKMWTTKEEAVAAIRAAADSKPTEDWFGYHADLCEAEAIRRESTMAALGPESHAFNKLQEEATWYREKAAGNRRDARKAQAAKPTPNATP
jgi:hypothetical protein